MSAELSSPSASEYNKNQNLNDSDTRDLILKYLYSKNLKSNFKINVIQKMSDLDNIRDGDYIICPKFKGSRSWVIFFSTQESKEEIPNYYAVSFPKHNQYKKGELKVHSVDLRVSKDLYKGTILEGIYYKFAKEKFLIIDEVYTLCGENQLLKSKTDRLNNLSNFLTETTVQTPNYHIYVCQYYALSELNLSELYDKIKGDNRIQDIIFYPQLYGRKIYQYTIVDVDLVDDIVKTGIFKLQKTNSPDVYHLISFRTNTKVDIAYIPDMATSKKCKQWFKDEKKKTELVVKCKMNLEHNKWMPLELVETDVEVSRRKRKVTDKGDDSDDETDNKIIEI
jgi:hypothetical protein